MERDFSPQCAEAEQRLHQAVTAGGWAKAWQRQWLEVQRATLQARAHETRASVRRLR
ncbi:hypothetical protein [Streptomyces syringium]|uniref:hypothetical protein n=1 Tax=Streptomyces syringium TaxID=76729 RepID=UPI0033A174DE